MMTAAAVEVRNLTKTFELPDGRSLKVLDDLSLDFECSAITCIVGPSGSGKTTLLNIIAGLTDFDGGTVRRANHHQGGARTLSYMFQDDRLLPWRNAVENVLLGIEVTNKGDRAAFAGEAKSLLASFGLAGFEGAYPAELSVGMRQRVAFARTLLVRPELLLLDEPFSNVDYEVRLQLENVLLRLCSERGTTIIIVTHDLEEAIVLGQKIFVLGPRPARLVRSIEICTPPKEREALQMRRSDDFGHYLGQLAGHVLKKK